MQHIHTTHTTQTAAEQLLTTATEQLDTHCSSAIFALDEGLAAGKRGDYPAAARWALRSMSHSIGVFAPAYKQSAALWLRAVDASPAADAIRSLSGLASVEAQS